MTETGIPETELNAQVSKVESKLRAYGIPLDEWGTGKAKTISHLAKEIIEGETALVEENGEIMRRVELVHVDVRHITNGVELQLIEEKQVFNDERERRRGLTGISEKMKPGEDPLISAARALAEELGVDTKSQIEDLATEEETQTSPSYPGLTTEYLRHEMLTYISDSDFKPEGYVEKQPDKSTFFVWREVEK